MGSIPILCINVNITIDTMLKFDVNVNINAQCERILKPCSHVTSAFASDIRNGFYGKK